MTHAAAECTGCFTLDGQEPELWDPFAGLYRCADGHVRVHTNFPHHRDGALRLLGLDPATATRTDAEQALLGWKALDFEQAAADHALVTTALRSFAEWDATPQGQAVAAQPLMTITRIADAPPRALPMQILDQASGFLMAFGADAALWRQLREGGSWHVQVSLAQTGHWLRGLGRIEEGLRAGGPSIT